MTANLMLIVRTPARRYAVRRDDVFDIRCIPAFAALDDHARFERPIIGVELGALLEATAAPASTRRHALLVPLRRVFVALLVDAVETFLERGACAPLPALIREQLAWPWAIGALPLDDELILQLDLRAIARSVLLNRSPEP